jgi:hypothetical protein
MVKIASNTEGINIMVLIVGELKAVVHYCVFNQKEDFSIKGEGFTQLSITKAASKATTILGEDNKAVGKNER